MSGRGQDAQPGLPIIPLALEILGYGGGCERPEWSLHPSRYDLEHSEWRASLLTISMPTLSRCRRTIDDSAMPLHDVMMLGQRVPVCMPDRSVGSIPVCSAELTGITYG